LGGLKGVNFCPPLSHKKFFFFFPPPPPPPKKKKDTPERNESIGMYVMRFFLVEFCLRSTFRRDVL